MRWLGRALAALLLAVSAAAAAPARAQSGERILVYDADLRIEPSGDLLVSEQITYDFGADERHGIIRDLPVRVRYDSHYDRVYRVEVLGVYGGEETPGGYELSTHGSLLRLRIGDPDQTISGRHSYKIDYRVRGALDGFASHDELYWNALGTQWEVPVDKASATVTAPAAISRMACYAGHFGSGRPCATSTVDGRTASFAETGLGPAEGLTVGVGFPTGAVPAPRPVLDERWSLARAFAATPPALGLAGAVLLVALLVALLVLGWLLRATGRGRRAAGRGVEAIPPQAAPPEGLRPAQASLLVAGAVQPVAVAATLVDLALRGYLRIRQFPRSAPERPGPLDWELVQLERADDDLARYERVLLNGLFLGGEARQYPRTGQSAAGGGTAVVEEGLASVQLSSLRHKFYGRFERTRSALCKDAVRQGWFAVRPDRVRATWARGGAVVAALGALLTVLAAWWTHLGLVPVPVVLVGLALVVGARWMPRRTSKGAELAARVRGFRDYLERTGVQRAGQRSSSDSYLPYGMVLGPARQPVEPFDPDQGSAPAGTSWYQGAEPFAADRFCSFVERLARQPVETRTSGRWFRTAGPWFEGASRSDSDRHSNRGGFWGGGGSSGAGGSSGGGSVGGGGGGGGGGSW